MSLIEIKNVSKSFFGEKALDGMNFSIGEGEIHCLIGENGCGKSTMIKIISGFYTYDDGELRINNKLFRKISPIESMHQGIQVIYQDFSLFPNLTVAENILMYDSISNKKQLVNWKGIKEKAEDAIKLIGVEMDVSMLVGDLPVAKQQIVAICRALMLDAKLIIMDEPTTALTHKEVNALYKIVEELNKKGISVLFVSHKLDEVMAVSQKLTIMRNGKNVFEGKASELGKEDMIYYMTGKRFEDSSYEYEKTDEAPILEIDGLACEGTFKDISFKLYKGEILGITGLLGCGRSELALSLFGLMPYTKGNIKICGKQVVISRPQNAIDNKIGYVPEDRLNEGIHLEQTIGDNSIVCMTKSLLNKVGLFNRKKMETCKETVLNKIAISGMGYNKLAKALSGGNQQKLVLVKWLASNPDILILNCPTVGVDVGSKNEIHALVKQLARDGMSVIVISDDIPELLQLCNRYIIMHDGEIAYRLEKKDSSIDDLQSKIVNCV